jgi:hypothetical protein
MSTAVSLNSSILQSMLINATVSPYSLFGFTNAIRYRPALNAYGVEVDIIPFFLGAAREGAGNPFKPTPEYMQAFSKQDSELTAKLLGLKVTRPKVFPILSLIVSLAQFIRLDGEDVLMLGSRFASQHGLRTITLLRNSRLPSLLSVLDIGVRALISLLLKVFLKQWTASSRQMS